MSHAGIFGNYQDPKTKYQIFLSQRLLIWEYLTTALYGVSKRQTRPTVSTEFFVDRPIAYDDFPSLLSFSLSLCRHLWSTPSICSMCRCGLLNPISKDCFWIPKGRDILSSPPHLWDSPPRQQVTCCKPSTCSTSSHHTQSPELKRACLPYFEMRTWHCHILPYFHQLATLAITCQTPELFWLHSSCIVGCFKKNFFYFSLNVQLVLLVGQN